MRDGRRVRSTRDGRGKRRVLAAAHHARNRGRHGCAGATRRGAKPDNPDTAGTRGRLITWQLSSEFLVVPEFWRGFDHGGLARSLSSDRGFEVITVDLATPPAAGELRLPRASIDALTAPPGSASDTRWIYYSSGTTAAPKGIRHTDASVTAGATGLVRMIGVTSSDVHPIAFPIAHIGGAVMLAAALQTGMRLALFDVFDPATTPFSIAAHKPTFLGTATPFFVAFLEAQRAHGDRPL